MVTILAKFSRFAISASRARIAELSDNRAIDHVARLRNTLSLARSIHTRGIHYVSSCKLDRGTSPIYVAHPGASFALPQRADFPAYRRPSSVEEPALASSARDPPRLFARARPENYEPSD